MLSAARRVAFEVVRRTFDDGAFTDIAFAVAADKANLDQRDRGQAQRLAYGAVQRRGTSDWIAERLTERPADRLETAVITALRIGLYEVFFADATPDHAVVSEAVELAKRAGATRGSGLVNAVLRRATAEREAIRADLSDTTAAGAARAHSYPLWLAELWWEELGPDDTRALMAAMNQPAETALRVNTLRAEGEELLARLAAEGVARPSAEALLAPVEALVVDAAIGPLTSRAIDAGELMPQSRASQGVVGLLDPQPGERILDLCAGPGIKTTAIAARMRNEGEVVAVELDPTRARRTAELAERLGAGCVRVDTADARSHDSGAGYDRVLVDPPCSDLGTLAARPDARWRKSPAAVAELAELGSQILRAGADAVRPGGVVVHSTCTISRAENEAVAGGLSDGAGFEADDLSREHPELAAADPRFIQTRADRDRTSGFFMARIRRAEA